MIQLLKSFLKAPAKKDPKTTAAFEKAKAKLNITRIDPSPIIIPIKKEQEQNLS